MQCPRTLSRSFYWPLSVVFYLRKHTILSLSKRDRQNVPFYCRTTPSIIVCCSPPRGTPCQYLMRTKMPILVIRTYTRLQGKFSSDVHLLSISVFPSYRHTPVCYAIQNARAKLAKDSRSITLNSSCALSSCFPLSIV